MFSRLLVWSFLSLALLVPAPSFALVYCICQETVEDQTSTYDAQYCAGSCSAENCGRASSEGTVSCSPLNDTTPETCEVNEQGIPDPECATQIPASNGGSQSPSSNGGSQTPASNGGSSSPSGGQKSNEQFVKKVPLNNPITGAPSTGSGMDLIALVAKNIINTLLGLVGIFAMIGFIWGGVTWMTSYGDTAKIERGKKMMIWGVVGLFVIFSSYAIANYIFEAIGATGAATTTTTPVNLDNDLNQLLEPLK